MSLAAHEMSAGELAAEKSTVSVFAFVIAFTFIAQPGVVAGRTYTPHGEKAAFQVGPPRFE